MPSDLCACGCKRPARPGSKYYDYERCRQARYRAKVKEEMEAAGLPVLPSLHVAHAGHPAGERHGDAQNGSRSGLQVSYRRAVRSCAEQLAHFGIPRHTAERVATVEITALLSARQRERLERMR